MTRKCLELEIELVVDFVFSCGTCGILVYLMQLIFVYVFFIC